MHSVIDIKSTILVTREGDSFVIMDLSTGKKVEKKSADFLGNLHKYDHEFLREFKKVFDSKKIKTILLSYEAADFMTDLIFFNGIDN